MVVYNSYRRRKSSGPAFRRSAKSLSLAIGGALWSGCLVLRGRPRVAMRPRDEDSTAEDIFWLPHNEDSTPKKKFQKRMIFGGSCLRCVSGVSSSSPSLDLLVSGSSFLCAGLSVITFSGFSNAGTTTENAWAKRKKTSCHFPARPLSCVTCWRPWTGCWTPRA